MEMDMVFPQHAEWRAARRNLAAAEIEYILLHGKRFHCAGAVIYYLRRRDIPDEHRSDNRWARLEGSAVVMARKSSTVITVWRNRRSGLRHIRRKPVYSRIPASLPEELFLLLTVE